VWEPPRGWTGPPPGPQPSPIGNQTYVFNNVTTKHVRWMTGTDPEGDPLTYRVILQSFRSADFGFGWDPTGKWWVRRLSISNVVSFRYVATDTAGNQSNVGVISLRFA
jgi:hypothetical protein